MIHHAQTGEYFSDFGVLSHRDGGMGTKPAACIERIRRRWMGRRRKKAKPGKNAPGSLIPGPEQWEQDGQKSITHGSPGSLESIAAVAPGSILLVDSQVKPLPCPVVVLLRQLPFAMLQQRNPRSQVGQRR